MKINRNNYEAYLMDYLDGKLNTVEVSELLLFLDENPDLKEEFEGLQLVVPIEPDALVSFDKASLKKPGYEEVKKNYEGLLVGKLEKELSLAQYQELNEAFILYPELKQDDALFQKTKLQPELTVVFPNKSLLKKRERVLSFTNTYLRVAAVLLALALGWWMLKPLSNTNSVKVADVKPVVKTIPGKTKPQPLHKVEESGNNAGITPTEPVPTVIPMEKETKTNAPQFVAQIESRVAGFDAEQKKTGNSLQKVNAQLAYQPLTNKEQKKEQKDFPNLSELVYQNIEQQKEKVVKEENKPEERTDPKPEDAGWLLVRLFNKVTGADVKVTRKYDENGDRKGYEIAANNFEFSTSK